MSLRALLQIVVLLLFALPNARGATNDGPLSQTGDDLFAKANTEFAAGNFKAAIADYQAVVSSGEWNANLFYDLGNAYFRHGDFGRAILNYDRALRLDPHHPEADANLRIAHDQAHSLELMPSALERYLNFGTANMFAIVAAIFFWLTIILLILRPGRVLWAIGGMFLAAICGFAAFRLENGTRGQDLAIVIAENVEARIATVDSARSVLALPAGSEVLILQERGDWNYAALPNDQRGWIAANAVERVRL
jgi:tetratricopeptide (TPR) repeat protein